jgi:hypothetical protein
MPMIYTYLRVNGSLLGSCLVITSQLLTQIDTTVPPKIFSKITKVFAVNFQKWWSLITLAGHLVALSKIVDMLVNSRPSLFRIESVHQMETLSRDLLVYGINIWSKLLVSRRFLTRCALSIVLLIEGFITNLKNIDILLAYLFDTTQSELEKIIK